MKKQFLLILLLFTGFLVKGQNNSCGSAAPFCTGTVFNFPAGVDAGDAEAGPDYGCLGSEPNPAWYYMQIDQPGTITINMVGTNNPNTQVPTNDIDFICYGPFTSLLNVCSQLTAANTVDCSYSGSPTEQVDIPNGQTGEFYIILITNFSNTACNIIFSQSGGTGSTSCGPFNNGPICVGQDLQLLSFFNEAEYSFSWTGPNGFTSEEANPMIPSVTVEMAGEYFLTTSSPSDTTIGSTIVEIAPSPNASSFTYVGDTCIGGAISLLPDSVFSNATYNWTFPNGNTQNGNPLNINSIDSSLVVGITLTYTIDGCTSPPVTVPIPVLPGAYPVILGEDHTCFDQTTNLSTAETYATYNWSNNTSNFSTNVNQGSFTVVVTNEYGCEGTSSPFVVENTAPTSQVNGIERYCIGDTLALNAIGNYTTYAWYDANNELITNNDSLLYSEEEITLVVVDEFGCQDSVLFNTPSTALPEASFTYDPLSHYVYVPAFVNYTNTSTATTGDPLLPSYWLYEPADGVWQDNKLFHDTTGVNAGIQYPDTGLYYITLTVTSELGCQDTVSSYVYIIDQPFVPNAFSPNGDLFNEYLKIPFLSQYPNNQVVIYNRWGKLVYEATEYKNDWNGDDLPEGTYFYVVTAPQLVAPLKGTITLIRN